MTPGELKERTNEFALRFLGCGDMSPLLEARMCPRSPKISDQQS